LLGKEYIMRPRRKRPADEKGVHLAKCHDMPTLQPLRVGETPRNFATEMVFRMNMHSEPGLPERPSTSRTRNRRTGFKLRIIASGAFLFAIIIFFSISTPPEDKVLWLAPGELARIKQGGAVARIKDKLMQWTAPVWKSYWSRQPQILIDSSLLTFSAAALDQTGLGASVATNTDGTRAWILSPAELSAFRQHLTTIPGASLLSRPRAQTAAGTSAQMFVGSTALMAGKSVPIGVTLDLAPKVRSGSLQLLLGITSTKMIASTSANAAVLSTNLAVACRVLLPNSSGLVVASGNVTHAHGTNYWLILSPTAVDARGNPIKL
jgi:hypothetical protein